MITFVDIFGISFLSLAFQAGLLTPLAFYLASLKSLGCFYFGCVFSSQWRAVTVNSQRYSANFKGIFENP